MITFTTPGQLELLGLKTFGLSSKDADQIGRFGTGLKYASAIVLRHGGSIKIEYPGETYKLGTSLGSFRGKEVNFVTLSGPNGNEQLGFTTDLGRDWEPWMAFREFYANTIDEGGSLEFTELETKELPADSTRITVDLPEFNSIFFMMDQYFIDPLETPLWENECLAIYPGKSKTVFYKNIAVQTFEEELQFRYNIKTRVELTEDRTTKYAWEVLDKIERYLLDCDSSKVLKKALHVDSPIENALRFNPMRDCTDTFLGTVDRLGTNANPSAAFYAARKRLESASSGEIMERADQTNENLLFGVSLLRAAGADLEGVRFAMLDDPALNDSFEVRGGNLIIINGKLRESVERSIAAVFHGYCSLKGHNWLIVQAIKNAKHIAGES